MRNTHTYGFDTYIREMKLAQRGRNTRNRWAPLLILLDKQSEFDEERVVRNWTHVTRGEGQWLGLPCWQSIRYGHRAGV